MPTTNPPLEPPAAAPVVYTTSDAPFWVEARTAIKSGLVMSYEVWHINDIGVRERAGQFRTTRKGGWAIALHLANKLRDDFNAGVK